MGHQDPGAYPYDENPPDVFAYVGIRWWLFTFPAILIAIIIEEIMRHLRLD
jgi:hypothetical protein